MWSDNETDVDLLGFTHLRTMVKQLATDDSLLPATIGVYGDWGSGKTSLMRMVCTELEKDQTTLVLWFNGWLFEGFDDAKTALMGNIIDEIIAKRSRWTKSKEKAGKIALKLVKKLPIFRALNIGARAATGYAIAGTTGATASLAVDGAALLGPTIDFLKKSSEEIDELTPETIEKHLKDEDDHNVRRNIREFHKDFADLLEETGIKRLVVFIDDLDRCVPDTIISTLEAIKLFLFAPKTAFIIGADERLVQYAVRRRFPELPGEKVDVAQDYLEKLIQFAVRVPPLGRAEMQTYINLLFCKKAVKTSESFEAARAKAIDSPKPALSAVRFDAEEARNLLGEVSADLVESLTMSQRIAPFFAAQLTGNPRQCKRFLNLLLLRIAMAQSRGVELKQRVLAKLMLLERFKNPSFRLLAEAQAAEDGKPKALAAAEKIFAGADDAGSKTSSQKVSEAPTKLKKDKEVVPEKVVDWLNDDWIKKDWLTQEPYLANIDLGPYFYFSRDKLGAMNGAAQRLSPAAKECFIQLFDESDAVRGLAIKHTPALPGGDAASVFDAIVQKLREEEDSDDEASALGVLCQFVGARSDLLNQFVLVVGQQAPTAMPVWFFRQFKELTANSPQAGSSMELLKKWHGLLPQGSPSQIAVGQVLK